MRPRRQVHIQRRFLPEQVYLLPAQPVFAFVGESQIKIPQNTCEDDAHLDISQTDHASSALVGRIQQEALREFPRIEKGNCLLLPYAIPWADLEGLEYVSIIRRELWVAKPSLRMELLCFGEKLLVVVQGVMVLRHHRLQDPDDC